MNPIKVMENGSIEISSAGLSALRNSVFPGATNESIRMAAEYCVARKLDVFKKPIHIVPMLVKDAKSGKSEYRDIIMPGIYELRTTAFRTGEMAGSDEPIFGDEINFKGVKAPEFCKVTVYRIINGERYAFTHVEYFEEAAATKSNGDLNSMWTKRPRGQLAKCAEAGALRKAFPDEMGGIMTSDEISEIDGPAQEIDITPKQDISAEVEKVKKMIAETNSDESRFLSFIGINSLDDFTPETVNQAIKALEAKVEKEKAKEAEAIFEPETIDI